ncbi:hypothetical protein I552_9755 [Mycobacterium xenopi 3993]|nr:hypothetical protein I552_9755 [Mycobacterium xenopi 3993]
MAYAHGPVVNLTRWMEAAGCLVFEEDFGTQRIDGLSQWVDDHPIILINANAAPDRKRLTKAHELGHLVLHSNGPTDQMEDEANRFAAEFLMPADEIRHELRRLDLGKLRDLKREWEFRCRRCWNTPTACILSPLNLAPSSTR